MMFNCADLPSRVMTRAICKPPLVRQISINRDPIVVQIHEEAFALWKSVRKLENTQPLPHEKLARFQISHLDEWY